MTRTSFLAGAAAWLAIGAGGLGVAVAGRDRLAAVLPDLAIDADALGGAITGIAAGALLLAAAHAAVAAGLRRRRSAGAGVGILLAALLAVAFGGLAAAAFASAQREARLAALLVAGGAASALVCLAYGWLTWRLVAERRAGSAT